MLTDAFFQATEQNDLGIFIKPKMVSILHDKENKDYYNIGKSIGKGSFATCYEVTLASTGQDFCCKALWKAKFKDDDKKQRMNAEVTIHRSLNHPNIVKYYSSMEDADFFYLFMEICHHGTLKDLIARRNKLTEPEVRFYMLQILKAVAFLKKNQIIHRDLKLANIFIAEDMSLKIGDFGLASKFDARDDMTIWCGTPNYTAPEVLDQEKQGYEVDMWALGIIMYTLLIGTPPFQPKYGSRGIYSNIRKAEFDFPPHENISSEAMDLIRMILRANPEERPTFQKVRKHPFFLGFTPSSLSQETLWHPPQFLDDAISAKRALRSNKITALSLSHLPHNPHKKAKYGASNDPNSPAPLRKTYYFEELMTEKSRPSVQKRKA